MAARVDVVPLKGFAGAPRFTTTRASRTRQRGKPKAQLAVGYTARTARPWSISA